MKLLRFILMIFLSVIVGFGLWQYFFALRYTFPEPKPFAGPLIYNPYEGVNARNWLKCNFHAHARTWNGITNGKATAKDIWRVYDSLGYDIHAVSNYQYIDTTFCKTGKYLPAYEHGYNILKTHQNVLGCPSVLWTDYIFPQTLSNKQDILSKLSGDKNAVVILNHPETRKGYSGRELAYLTNYHCIEVLNPAVSSFAEWDSALSAGKRVFIVGSDDIHNVLKKGQAGRMCTFVNAPAAKPNAVLESLKEGRSYGVKISPSQKLDSFPRLEYLILKKDTVELKLSRTAKEIKFIGTGGRLLATYLDTAFARYPLQKADRYARAAVTYENGTALYFNPVFFIDPKEPRDSLATVDKEKTIVFRTTGAFLIFLWISLMRSIFVRKKVSHPSKKKEYAGNG